MERLVLPDDALSQLVLHAQQAAAFLLRELRHGDSGAFGHYFCNRLGCDFRLDFVLLLSPFFAPLLALLLRLALLVAQVRGLLELLRGRGIFFFFAEVVDASFERFELVGSFERLYARARRGFVYEVYRLVGEESVGDVAFRERRRRFERRVGYAHAVVLLVSFAQPFKYQHRFLDRGLVHLHGLEAPLKRRVLLYVLSVFVYRSRADYLEFAAREARLQNVRRVHRALGSARADYRVYLVYEEDYPLRLAYLLYEPPHALLELAAVFRPSDEVRDVELHDALALEHLRDVAGEYPLREALSDRGFADAGLAYKHGVVFRAAREYLNDALNFLRAPYYGVQLALRGKLRKVRRQLVRYRRVRRRFSLRALFAAARLLRSAGADGAAALAQLGDERAAALERHSVGGEHLRRHAIAFGEDGEEYVLRPDIIHSHAPRLAHRKVHDDLHALARRQVAFLRVRRSHARVALYLADYGFRRRPVVHQHARNYRVVVVEQREQHVLRPYDVVAHPQGLFMRYLEYALSAFRKILPHLYILFSVRIVGIFQLAYSVAELRGVFVILRLYRFEHFLFERRHLFLGGHDFIFVGVGPGRLFIFGVPALEHRIRQDSAAVRADMLGAFLLSVGAAQRRHHKLSESFVYTHQPFDR